MAVGSRIGPVTILEFVMRHTERGECKCGKCIDVGMKPDPAHSVNMVFFRVATIGDPSREEFIRLTKEHTGAYGSVDLFDGKEHNYQELGAWIGDQGFAMQYMALGVSLGVFDLLSGVTVLGLAPDDPLVMRAAQMGYLSVQVAR